VERRTLYEDDLTEERLPSPAHRDDVAKTETLDPDALGDDGKPAPPATPRPRAVTGDPGADDDEYDDDDEDEEDDDEE